MKKISIAAIAICMLTMASCTKDSIEQQITPPAPVKENSLNITLHFSYGRHVTVDSTGVFCRYENPQALQSVIQIA
ncbi:MAG: hypothetical protein MUF29_09665, partial [Chitinophagaceae bacterium]|nr:hypothetical protein [Chitinophagaceae bacterium]